MQGNSPNTMTIRPKSDRMIRFPMDGSAGVNGGKFVPAEGAEVPQSRYWLRKIRCGDCTRIQALPEPEPTPTPAAPKKKAAKKAAKKTKTTKRTEG